MNGKTEGGFTFSASQAHLAGDPVKVRNAQLSSWGGDLRITANIGDQRGYRVEIILTIEELLAWLPELHTDALEWAVEQELEERE